MILSAQAPDGTILVFGMPRSGTTWLGKLYDSHPSALYRHEPDSWRKLKGIPLVPRPPYSKTLQEQIRQFEASIAGLGTLKVCGKTPIFTKNYLSTLRIFAYRAGVRVSQLAASIGVELAVPGAPRRLSPGSRLVWKSIESVGRLGLILESLPRSKAILLLRHPCGYIASVLRGESQLRFEHNQGASEDYGILEQLLDTRLAQEKGLSLEFFATLHPEERLAWRWVLFNDQAIRETEKVDRCAVVRYEDVCRDPVNQMRDHFAFVGLEWSSQTEAFIRESTRTADDAYYGVFRNSKIAAEKWRRELSAETVTRIMAIVKDTLPGSLFAETDAARQV